MAQFGDNECIRSSGELGHSLFSPDWPRRARIAYFHTLFFYTITKKLNYGIVKYDDEEKECDIDAAEYISDLFKMFYAEFLPSFDAQELIATLEA